MITYRKAQPKDSDTLLALRMAYVRETHDDLPEESLEKIKARIPGYFQEHLNRDIVVYLAEDDSRAVGCVFFVLINKPASPLFITGKTGTLMNVYTMPEYRRMGIAKTLVKMAIDDGAKWDLSYIDLRSTKCGYPLYKSTGFTEDKSIYMSMKLFFDNE
ncbi:MAG: GNAT family N-acetyltransferase [Oscillospiraceae bacterium]|nr:GNAT family N-acetyltransferase [Oscillospiraceae bacterium]